MKIELKICKKNWIDYVLTNFYVEIYYSGSLKIDQMGIRQMNIGFYSSLAEYLNEDPR